MRHFRLWKIQVAVVLSIASYVCARAGSISIHSPERSLSRSVQEDVFFSVDVECAGVPTIQWTFMSGLVSRAIGTWQPGVYANISADYSSRAQPCDNGSLGLTDLQLQDAGFYLLTVTDAAGSSRDAALVLQVNEVLYEDLQYLSVSGVGLAAIAGLLMLSMWLLDRLYRRMAARRHKKQMRAEGDATELQTLNDPAEPHQRGASSQAAVPF